MRAPAILGPVELQKERMEFLKEAAAKRPEILSSLRELLPQLHSLSPTKQFGLLLQWTQRFNLEAPWVRQCARLTLTAWSQVPPSNPLTWPPEAGNVVYRMPRPDPPTFTLPQCEPDIETVEKYAERVAVAVKPVARRHYRAAGPVLAASAGWRQVTPTRRGPGPKRQPQPLQRLALYQVGCMSYAEIARKEQLAGLTTVPSSVQHSVQAAAKRIELKLRK
jgi:hypothetical protein